VKVRQSASLVAGVCTLCVAASGTVTPLPTASAAAAPAVNKAPVVSRPYLLDAAISPIDQLASFPYQAAILILKAAAGVAGGADGLGGLGPQSLQGLPAVIYQAITQPTTASNLETLPAAFQTAIGTEETALQNLTTLPARIAALLPSATTLNANTVNAKSTLVSDVKTDDAVTPSTTKPSLTSGPLALNSAPAVKKAPPALTAPLRVSNLLDPVTEKNVATGAGKDATTGVDKSSTTPQTKKTNDNPVSNAIKSITKAAKDSDYSGKHRAGA
jgi:hypothetical protein